MLDKRANLETTLKLKQILDFVLMFEVGMEISFSNTANTYMTSRQLEKLNRISDSSSPEDRVDFLNLVTLFKSDAGETRNISFNFKNGFGSVRLFWDGYRMTIDSLTMDFNS